MHRRTASIAGIALVAIVALWGSAGGDANTPQPTATATGASDPQVAGSPGPRTHNPGVAAIVPLADAALGQPAIIADAARAYVLANMPESRDPASTPQITSIEFLTADQAETLLDGLYLRAPDELLCVVTIEGKFVPRLPPGVSPVSFPDEPSVLYWIFDALTGNLLARIG